MNVNTTLEALYVHHQRLEYLGEQLAASGFKMAAEELRREAYKLGCQVGQLEGVLDDYKIDIAALNQQSKPASQPKFYGVDGAEE